jgi:ribosome-binding factor A
MSHKRERLESVIKRTLQTILAEGLSDPRLDALFTVTGVKVSEDRRDATVLLVMTPESRESRAIHGLAAAVPHLKRELSRRAAIHRPPDLTFKIDKAHKKQAAVLDALRLIESERAARDGAPPDADDAPHAAGPEAGNGDPHP